MIRTAARESKERRREERAHGGKIPAGEDTGEGEFPKLFTRNWGL